MGVGGAEEQGLVGYLSGSTVTREADGFSDRHGGMLGEGVVL